jgi:hypothetical protein
MLNILDNIEDGSWTVSCWYELGKGDGKRIRSTAYWKRRKLGFIWFDLHQYMCTALWSSFITGMAGNPKSFPWKKLSIQVNWHLVIRSLRSLGFDWETWSKTYWACKCYLNDEWQKDERIFFKALEWVLGYSSILKWQQKSLREQLKNLWEHLKG